MLKYGYKSIVAPVAISLALLSGSPAFSESKTDINKSESLVEKAATIVGNKILSGDIADKAIRKSQDGFTAEQKRAIENAIAALKASENAIVAIDKKDAKAALSELEKAIGKIEVALAISPDMALAPVSSSSEIFDVQTSAGDVKKTLDEAMVMLKSGRLQAARPLISSLASEIIVSVSNVPLGTYPQAIKLVVPLIEKKKFKEAKIALLTALSTLIVEDHVIPLPIVRAEASLIEAEKLAGKAARSEKEEKSLAELLKAARNELELGEALGYGTAAEFKEFYKHLSEISKKTEKGKSGTGFFDGIKDTLSSLRQKIFQ